MEGWRGEGLLLSSRRHGETSAILDVFTAEQGRHMGVLRGGASRKVAAHLQQGTQLALVWQARLADQLGQFTAEPLGSRPARLMQDPVALAALASACALLARALPERAPHPGLYEATQGLLDRLGDGAENWAQLYVGWEMRLLADLGFGLDLRSCAVTGAREGLSFVSPKSGRAVSDVGAQGWKDRLLPLPGFLSGEGPPTAGPEALGAALRLTGHFLGRMLARERDGAEVAWLPEARVRLVARLSGQ